MIQNKKRARIKIILLSLLAILTFFIPSALATASFEKYVTEPLTSLPKELHEAPSIAIHENTVHVVWTTWPDEYTSEVYYKRSLDNGKTWGYATKINSNESKATCPSVAVHDNMVHIVWKDYRHGNPEVYHTCSTDNGETWVFFQRVTFNSSRKSNIYDIDLALDGINVYVVWKDYRSGSSEIFFKRSNDNGKTWSDDQRLTSDYAPSYVPVLSLQNVNLYVVYEDWGTRTNICFLKSVDSGNNWTQKSYLTDDQNAGNSENPDIAVEENILYLVWQDDGTGNSEIYFKKSSDGGENWSDSKQLTFDSIVSINPKIYVYMKSVTVIWQEQHNGSFDIYYKTSTDGGETWNENQQLVANKDCYDVEIAGEADNIHMVWQEYHEPCWADIWHMRNGDQKPTITSVVPLQTSLYIPDSISITVEGYDVNYDKSDLTCIVQYLAPSNDWQNLDAKFENDSWMALLTLDETSKVGSYSIRAKLVNPDNNQSEWTQIFDIEVLEKEPPSGQTPGFEFLFFIIVLCICILVVNIKHYFKNKKEKRR